MNRLGRQLAWVLCVFVGVGAVCAHAASDEGTDVESPRAQWEALVESVGKGDRAHRDVWERLERGQERLTAISRDAVIAACAERGIGFEGVWVYPECMGWSTPDMVQWPNEASRDATERAFKMYLDERLSEAPDRVRLLGGVRVDEERQPFLEPRVDWIKPLREFARWESARMWSLLKRGEGVGSALPFENTLAMGAVAMRSPTFIGRLSGSALFLLPMDNVKGWIESQGMDEATAMAFGRALDRQRAEVPPVSFMIEGERLWAMGDTDRMFEQITAGTFDPGLDDALRAIIAQGAVRAPTVAAIERFYSALETWAQRPVRERREMKDDLGDMVTEMEKTARVAAYLCGTAERCVRSMDTVELQLDGVRLMLALEAYKARHGAYPEALGALAPEFIDAIPEDPFAPDGAWRYRLIEAGEEVPGVTMKYVLYSVGYDGEDDGAKRAHLPAQSLLPGEEGAGTDFVPNAIGE